MVASMIKFDADLEKQTHGNEGPTALGWARGYGNATCVTLLIEAGAEWDADWGANLEGGDGIDWEQIADDERAAAEGEGEMGRQRREKEAAAEQITWAGLIGF